MIPGVGKWGAKLAIKPASKVMDDIKITLRGDGDWEQHRWIMVVVVIGLITHLKL